MIKDGIKLENETVCSFLMIGQSNMAGRGEFGDVPAIFNPQCFMLRMGRWQPMREPINTDRPIFEGIFHTGLSLAASFADELAKDSGNKIGLIPCADGGTSIKQWMPGEVLYDHAVMMTKLAMRSSKLCGILWHQGENDCNTDEDLYSHKDKFKEMITSLRRDLGAEDVPVIIGELSHTYAEEWKLGRRPDIMNEGYHAVANEIPLCAVVSSEGLSMKSDGIHFDAKALRIFGKRFFDVYKNVIEGK